MHWTEIATVLVALYGATTGTIALYLQWRDRSVDVRVEVKVTELITQLDGYVGTKFFISAKNPGRISVTLEMCGVDLPSGCCFVMPTPHGIHFPRELVPGKGCSGWTDVLEVVKVLRSKGYCGKIKLVGWYKDQVDRVYRSEPFDLNLDEYP